MLPPIIDESSDLRVLVNDDAARDESLVVDLNVAGNESATSDDDVVADDAVMRDVAGRHDVVAIANGGDAFRRSATRNGVVFANLVVVADAQVAAFTAKVFVEGIGAEHGAC